MRFFLNAKDFIALHRQIIHRFSLTVIGSCVPKLKDTSYKKIDSINTHTQLAVFAPAGNNHRS